MTPEQIRKWELDHGKVWIDDSLEKLIKANNFIPLINYTHFINSFEVDNSQN